MIGTSNQAMEIAAFEKQFDSRIKEFIVLTEGSPSAGKGGNAVLWNAYLKILAVIDTGADALYNPKCSLTWLMTDEQAKSKDKLFGFEGKKIYRIKARESFAKGKNYLMVCGVTERNCTDDRLVHILEEYEQPVEISVSGCDKLVLNKELDLFEGNCSANGSEFMLMLNVDDDIFAGHTIAVEGSVEEGFVDAAF